MADTPNPKPTLKSVSAQVAQLRKLLHWAVFGFVAIAVGVILFMGIFVVNVGNEKSRACDVAARSIHLTLNGIYNLPQRSSIPKRTPAEEKQRQAGFDATNKAIDAALAQC